MEGMSHRSFMDSTKVPSYVTNNDLKPEVAEQDAHNLVGDAMVNFIFSILGSSVA